MIPCLEILLGCGFACCHYLFALSLPLLYSLLCGTLGVKKWGGEGGIVAAFIVLKPWHFVSDFWGMNFLFLATSLASFWTL